MGGQILRRKHLWALRQRRRAKYVRLKGKQAQRLNTSYCFCVFQVNYLGAGRLRSRVPQKFSPQHLPTH